MTAPAIPSDIVGATAGPLTARVDRRWTMAYAAGIDDLAPAYLDTTASDGIVAHPLFAVCVEWPVIVAVGSVVPDLGLVGRSGAAGLHATHDLTVHRLVRPDEELATALTIVGVTATRPGALVAVELQTRDTAGDLVATTRQDLLYLGAGVSGADRPARPSDLPERPADVELTGEHTIPIAANAAHVYTECARIWNPIHTDADVARRRGLPQPPLHGTATLAHAVSTIVAEYAGGAPAAIRRVRGRFRAMVTMPSELLLVVSEAQPAAAGVARWFEVRTAAGAPAIDRGCVIVAR